MPGTHIITETVNEFYDTGPRSLSYKANYFVNIIKRFSEIIDKLVE